MSYFLSLPLPKLNNNIKYLINNNTLIMNAKFRKKLKN